MPVTIDDVQNLQQKHAKQYDVEAEQNRARLTQYADVITDWEGDSYKIPTEESNIDAKFYTGYNVPITDSKITEGSRLVRYQKYYISFAISKDMLLDKAPLDNGLARRRVKQVAATARKEDECFLGVIKDPVTGKYRLFDPATDTDIGYFGGILNKNYGGVDGTDKYALNLTDSIMTGGNLISIDFASSGTGVSKAMQGTFVDKYFLIQQRLQELNVFEPNSANTICTAISPAVQRELRMLEIRNNMDYGFNTIGNVGTTTVIPGLGLTVVVTNMLPTMNTPLSGDASKSVKDARMVPFWLKNRVQIVVPKRTEFETLTINDKVDVRYRSLATGMFGAARKDERSTFIMPVFETGVSSNVNTSSLSAA